MEVVLKFSYNFQFGSEIWHEDILKTFLQIKYEYCLHKSTVTTLQWWETLNVHLTNLM